MNDKERLFLIFFSNTTFFYLQVVGCVRYGMHLLGDMRLKSCTFTDLHTAITYHTHSKRKLNKGETKCVLQIRIQSQANPLLLECLLHALQVGVDKVRSLNKFLGHAGIRFLECCVEVKAEVRRHDNSAKQCYMSVLMFFVFFYKVIQT